MFVGFLAFFVLRTCRGGNAESAPVQTTEAQSVEQAVVEEPDYIDINLLMVGDILFHYQVRQSGLQADGTRSYDHIYEHFKSELADKDIKVLNQETPLGGAAIGGDAPDGFGSYPMFNGPQEMADAEAKAGFNVILRATNHALDAGYEGARSELSYWKEKFPEVTVIGEVNPDDASASIDDVYVYEKDGFKVAVLNYTFDLNGIEDPNGIVSMLEEEHVHTTMAKARELADMIVVFPHWGEEYETQPNEEQRMWAELLVEDGADVIIGNHPHVMQPVEVLADADGNPVPCFWSTGNFVSTSPEDMSLLGGVPEVTLRKDKDGNCSVESAQMKVVVTHLGNSDDMTVYLLPDWTDELAASNWLNTEMNPNTDNTTLTKEWANDFCLQVLGSDFNTQTGSLTVDLTDVPVTTSTVGDEDAETDTEGTGEGTSSQGSSTTGSGGTSSTSTTGSGGTGSTSTGSSKTSSGRTTAGSNAVTLEEAEEEAEEIGSGYYDGGSYDEEEEYDY